MSLISEINERKKNDAASGKTSGSLIAEVNQRKKYMSTPTDGVNDDYIKLFTTDAGNFINATKDDTSYTTWKDLSTRADTIASYLYKNSGSLDEGKYTSAANVVNSFYNSTSDYYKYASEDDYKQALKVENLYKQMLGEDLDALQSNYDKAKELSSQFLKSTDKDEILSLAKELDALGITDRSGRQAINKSLDEMEKYLYQVKKTQQLPKFEKDSRKDADFEKYAAEGAAIQNPTYNQAGGLLADIVTLRLHDNGLDIINAVIPGQINYPGQKVNNIVTFSRENAEILKKQNNVVGDAIYAYMNDDEVDTFNYLLAKNGEETAMEYLNAIKERLTDRESDKIVEEKKNWNALSKALFNAYAGATTSVENFELAMDKLFDFSDGSYGYAAPSTMQLASQKLGETVYGDFDKLMYDTGGTVGGMVPSMIAATISNLVLPGSGTIVGASMMGVSAAGGAYQEMLNNGYSKGQATTYGILVGASEGALEALLGGVFKASGNVWGKLGSKLSDAKVVKFAGDTIAKVLSKISIKHGDLLADLLTGAGKYLGDMGSEAIEEGTQTILETLFKGIVTGEWDKVNAEEVLYSALLGAITAGVMNGPRYAIGTTVDVVKTQQIGKNVNVEGLKDYASKQSLDSAAYKLAGKITEQSDSYSIGKLFREASAFVSEQNLSDIRTSLERKGLDSKSAETLAKKFAEVVDGKYFTRSEIKLLNANESLYDTLVDVVINPNSTVNQRIVGFNEAVAKVTSARVDTPTDTNTNIGENVEMAQNPALSEDVKTIKTNSNTQTLKPVDASFESENDGIARLKDSGKEIEIAGVATVEGNNVVLKTKSGETVSASNVKYANSDQAAIYNHLVEGAKRGAINTAYAKLFLEKYAGQDVGTYSKAFLASYLNGLYGMSDIHLRNNVPSEWISEEDMMSSFNLGRSLRKSSATEDQNNVNKATEEKAREKETENKTGEKAENNAENSTGNVKFISDPSKISKIQKYSLKNIEQIAKKLGVNFCFYESYLGEDGTRVYKDENGVIRPAHNGFYTSDGVIYIDLNAGSKGQGTILYTASHELTHHIKRLSPKLFSEFQEFLFETYEKHGYSVDKMAQKKIDRARKNGRSISYETALEEVVADSCMKFLLDSDAIQKMQKLERENKGLFNAIISFFRDFFQNIKTQLLYKKYAPESVEAQILEKMKEEVEELERRWTEMLMDTKDKFSTSHLRGHDDGMVKQGEITDALTHDEDGILWSMRTENEPLPKQVISLSNGEGTIVTAIDGLTPTQIKGVSDKTINGYTGRQVRENAMFINGFTEEDVGNVNKFMDAMAEFMKEAGVTYRFIGLDDVENAMLHYTRNPDGSIKSIVLSAMVKNGEYPVNLDFSSICKKRIAMSKVFDALAKRGSLDNGTVKLTPKDIFEINKALKDAGYETACLGCFVESKRYNAMKWAEEFCKKWNEAVLSVNKNASYFNYGNNTFTESEFTLEQAVKIDEAANNYNNGGKNARLENKLNKCKERVEKGLPPIETLSKTARGRLEKSETISEELKEYYLNNDPTTFTIEDVEFLLVNGVLPGASTSNKQNIKRLVASGEVYQHLLRPSDILTDRGVSKLLELPNFKAVLYGHYGSGTPKLMQGFTPYNSEIALLPDKKGKQTLVEYLYTIAGVRMQSFSDFQIQNIYDYLQMVADLAAKKLPAHAYTKEISFAKLLGMTGIKTNLSVMFDIDPTVDEAHAGLIKYNPLLHKGEYATIVLEDEQGKWVYNVGDYQTQKMFAEVYPDDPKRFLQSIGFADAVKLQTSHGYSANCGIIGVGYSRLGVVAMLNDKRIRYIIPYHSSGLPEVIKIATNIELATDYTNTQNNTKLASITDKNGNSVDWNIKDAYKRLKDAKAVITELNDKIANDGWVVKTKKAQAGHGSYKLYDNLQETNEPRQTADNFIEWCIGNGTLPLFFEFANHENYYKMLYDFNMYDCVTEEYAPQKAVTNTYPTMVDGQVQARNVADGNFDTTHFESVIDKQMAFMNEYNRNLDSDIETLVDNMEKGNYSFEKPLADKFKNNTVFSERDYTGNGYDGYSMSNNARDAYKNGEKPISKWTKADIIDAVKEINPDIDCSKLNADTLRKELLHKSSWHHTSMHYNKTDFYAIDEDYVSKLTQEDIDDLAKRQVKSKTEKRNKTFDEKIDEAYRKVQVIVESGILTTENSAIKRLITGKGFEDGYNKAVALIKRRDAAKIAQWKKLAEDHQKRELADLYESDIEEYINQMYVKKTLSRNSNIFHDMEKHFANSEKQDVLYSERDEDYIEAVNNGDMETAQKMVEEVAKAAGYTIKGYHGTNGEYGFTKFRSGKRAIFISEDLNTAKSYSGSETHDQLANTWPKDVDTLSPKRLAQVMSKYNILTHYYKGANHIYLTLDEAKKYGGISSTIQTLPDFKDGVIASITEDGHVLDYQSIPDSREKLRRYIDLSYIKHGNYGLYADIGNSFIVNAKGSKWNDIEFDGDILTTDKIVQRVKDIGGYNSVTFLNIMDYGAQGLTSDNSKLDTVYAIFDPNRVKSADPVVYDDNGEIIPLSERFNAEEEDIRYSERDEGEEKQYGRLMQFMEEHRTPEGKYDAGETFNFLWDNPENRFVERIYMGDKSAKNDLAMLLKDITNINTLESLEKMMLDPLSKVKHLLVGPIRTVKNVFKKRKEEIITTYVQGTDLELKNGEVSLDYMKALFNRLNTDAEVGELAKKVFKTAEYLGVNIRFANQTFSKSSDVAGDNAGDMIEYKTSYFNKTSVSNQEKARVILHELIHACTIYAMEYGNLVPDKFDGITSVFNDIYNDIKNDPAFKNEYGLKNAKEMVAELANPRFVGLMKKKSVWDRILDAICRLFGFHRGNTAYDNAMQCLEYILDNPNIELYRAYAESYREMMKRDGDDVFGWTFTNDGETMYSERDEDTRTELVEALRSIAKPAQHRVLDEYAESVDLIVALEKRIAKINKQIKDLKKSDDTKEAEKKIKSLEHEKRGLQNNVATLDSRLLRLSTTKAFQSLLKEQERVHEEEIKHLQSEHKEDVKATKQEHKEEIEAIKDSYKDKIKATKQEGKEALSQYRKNIMMRKRRQQIADEFKKLHTLVMRGNKKKHVLQKMEGAVADLLSTFAPFMSNLDEHKEFEVRVDKMRALEKKIAHYEIEIDNIRKEIEAAKDVETKQTLEVKLAKYQSAYENATNELKKQIELYEKAQSKDAAIKARLTMLKAAYESMANGATDAEEAYVFDADVAAIIGKAIDSLQDGSNLRSMTAEQLDLIHDALKAIIHKINQENEAFGKARSAKISELAASVSSQVKEVGGEYHRVLPGEKSYYDIRKPYNVMRDIGSDTLSNIFLDVRKGEDVFYNDVNDAKNFMLNAKEKYGYKNWDFKKTCEFTAKNGKKFQLTLEQMMAIYAYSKRSQAIPHLTDGGIVLNSLQTVTELVDKKDKNGNVKQKEKRFKVNTSNAYALTPAIISEIAEILAEGGQKGYVDEMQRYLSDVMGAKGNEASLELYGIKIFKEKNYFPLKSSKAWMATKFDNSEEGAIKNWGAAKELTPHANNPIVLEDFTEVWARHIDEMSKYHAFVVPVENFQRVWNYRDGSNKNTDKSAVKQAIINAHGIHAADYIERLIRDINGGVRHEGSAVDKLVSLAKKGAVAGSLSVFVQQFSAGIRAMAYINPKYFATTIPNPAKHAAEWAEVKRYAAIAGIKEMGRFDTNLGKSTSKWIEEDNGFLDKVDDALAKGPSYADEVTWIHIWKAVKKEQADIYKKKFEKDPSHDELMKLAGERFTEVILLTQVYDSTLSRSQIMRNKDGLSKLTTAFMAESITTMNMIIDAAVQFKRAKTGKEKAKILFANSGAIVGSIVVNSLLKALVLAARDDDDDESYVEKYTEAAVGDVVQGLNPVTMLPVAKDIWNIFAGYDIERMDMSLVSDLYYAVNAFDNDKKTDFEKWSGLIGSISAFFGIPVKNVTRDVVATINAFETVFAGPKTTLEGIKQSIIEGLTGEEKSNSQLLYEAVLSGNRAEIKKMESNYKNQDAVNEALRKALADNDPRIREAAIAALNGDSSKRVSIAKQIVSEGYFSQDIVTAAINNMTTTLKRYGTNAAEAQIAGNKKDYNKAVDSLEEKGLSKSEIADIIGDAFDNYEYEDEVEDEVVKYKSYYKVSDINDAYENGDNNLAAKIIAELTDTKKKNGDTEKEAKASIRSSMTSYWKPLYVAAYKNKDDAEMRRIRNILAASGLYGRPSEVLETVKGWLKS